jgi:hypothetical protein
MIMNFTKMTLFVGLIAAASAEPLGSREESSRTDEKQRKVTIACVGMPEGLSNPLLLKDRDEQVEVILSRGISSGPYRIPAGGRFELLREVASPVPEHPGFIPVAIADLPPGINNALLILIPQVTPDIDKPGGAFRVLIRDLDAFKGGEYLFMNLARSPVAVEFGGQRMALRPGGSWIARAAEPGGEPVNVPTSYFRKNLQAPEEPWKRISSSTLVAYPTRREVCLFYGDGARVRYCGVTVPVSVP